MGEPTDSFQETDRKSRLTHFFLIVIATLCLAFGFVNNSFGVADSTWFKNHQKDTQGHVIGNLIRSSSHGLWEHSGLNGINQSRPPYWKLERPWNGGLAQQQHQMYLDGTSKEHYNPYFSQPGGQAWVFIALDKLTNKQPEEKLQLYRWITGFSSAFILSLLLSWLLKVGGWGAALVAGVSMVYSPWLTVFGANLWWFFSSFFIPMAITALATGRASSPKLKMWFFLSGLGIFIKGFLTGFEYISTTLVMAQIPLILDLVRRNDSLQCSLARLLASCFGSIAGAVLTILLLCIQISIYRGDTMAGLDHILHSYQKRSSGAKENLNRHYNYGLEADVEEIVKGYRQGVCFDLDSKPLRERKDHSEDSFMRPFRYDDLISTLKILSLVWLVWAMLFSSIRWALISFLLATWCSLLGPLSWFIIFKGHSSVHWHMNYICWHMPFSFMVAAMVGITGEYILKATWWPVSKLFKLNKKEAQTQKEPEEKKPTASTSQP